MDREMDRQTERQRERHRERQRETETEQLRRGREWEGKGGQSANGRERARDSSSEE